MSSKRNLREDVYEVVKKIPKGKVTTYGAIAKYIGMRAPRVIGWILNDLGDEVVPAHRVVNAKGLLTGKHHFEGPDEMQKRLEAEGVCIIDQQVHPLSTYFWDPNELEEE